MEAHQIDDRNVGIARLEHPINNWLAEQGLLHILAGAIRHPLKNSVEEDGMLYMSQFCSALYTGNPFLVQEEGVDKDVKQWLITKGGLGPQKSSEYLYGTRLR